MVMYTCECCDYTTKHKTKYTRHMESARHSVIISKPTNPPKVEYKYICECCDYGTNVSSTYTSHCRSSKHLELMGETEFQCGCGFYLSTERALVFHERGCSFVKGIVSAAEEPVHSEPDNISIDELVAAKVNEEIGSKLSELTDTLKALVGNQGNTYNNNSTNTQNNQININLFMAENCKDAMPLTEFSDSIKVSRKDIDKLNITGNPDSTAEIIGRELSKLAVNKRPIHCTDLKRNTVYIKDDDGLWTNEDSDAKLRVLVVQTFRKHAGAYEETMKDYKSGGDTSYWCKRAKHIDEGNFCRKMKSKHISARVYNTICDSATLNQSIARDSMKLS